MLGVWKDTFFLPLEQNLQTLPTTEFNDLQLREGGFAVCQPFFINMSAFFKTFLSYCRAQPYIRYSLNLLIINQFLWLFITGIPLLCTSPSLSTSLENWGLKLGAAGMLINGMKNSLMSLLYNAGIHLLCRTFKRHCLSRHPSLNHRRIFCHVPSMWSTFSYLPAVGTASRNLPEAVLTDLVTQRPISSVLRKTSQKGPFSERSGKRAKFISLGMAGGKPKGRVEGLFDSLWIISRRAPVCWPEQHIYLISNCREISRAGSDKAVDLPDHKNQ